MFTSICLKLCTNHVLSFSSCSSFPLYLMPQTGLYHLQLISTRFQFSSRTCRQCFRVLHGESASKNGVSFYGLSHHDIKTHGNQSRGGQPNQLMSLDSELSGKQRTHWETFFDTYCLKEMECVQNSCFYINYCL